MVNFDNYNLDDVANGIRVTKVDVDKGQKAFINAYQMARKDGAKFTGKTLGEKPLLIEGVIVKTTLADLQLKCDELRYALSGEEKNLDVDYAGQTRRFVATLQNIVFTTKGTYAVWSAAFTCYEAFGKATTDTTLTMKTGLITTALANFNETFAGTVSAKPVFEIDFAMVDYSAAKYIELLNTANSKRLRITRNWCVFDKLRVDCQERKVSLYKSTRYTVTTGIQQYGESWVSTGNTALGFDEASQLLKFSMPSAAATMAISYGTAANLKADPTTMGKLVFPLFIPTPTSGTVAKLRITFTDYDGAGGVSYWEKTTQFDGSAIAYNAVNWFELDCSTARLGGTTTPANLLNLASIELKLYATATMQLAGVGVNSLDMFKAAITAQEIDFEGNFPDWAIGAGVVSYADEFAHRRATITEAKYTKRYL